MARLPALQRLIEGLWRPSHVYAAPLQVFPDISVDALARELDIVAIGSERGKRNEPPTNSAVLDDVEHDIVDRIYAERKAAYQQAVDQLETYSDRLSALDFEGRFTAIKHAAPDAVSQFKVEALQGRDQLFHLRRTLVDNEKERNAFKKRHRLERAPRVSSGTATFLKVAFLLFLFVLETYVNGAFLAKGNELGLLGGVVEAFAFAVLNLVVSFYIGLFGVRQVNTASIFRKLLGALSFIIWVGFALCLNLALSHYREISGVLYEDAGAQVVQRLITAPLGLMDIKSWLFFALGLVFSIAALVDGILFTDPCPGYAELEKRVMRALDDYIDNKTDLIANLESIRDDTRLNLEEVQRDLGKRRGEHDAILEGRTRMLGLFDQHQEQLQRCANALLSKYRTANRQTRSDAAPVRFDQPWVMERITMTASLPESLLRTDLNIEIKAMQDLLSAEIAAIHQAFEQAVTGYHQIDKLIPEEAYGAATKQIA